MSGMREWRAKHPKATPREMERELDARWVRVRARMLEDMALASPAADWTDAPADEQPTCPDCDQPLQRRGFDTRNRAYPRRSTTPPHAPVRHLPGLWRRSFSPSTRNSPCCLTT